MIFKFVQIQICVKSLIYILFRQVDAVGLHQRGAQRSSKFGSKVEVQHNKTVTGLWPRKPSRYDILLYPLYFTGATRVWWSDVSNKEILSAKDS